MKTKEEFIEKAKKVHGDKFDYSKVDYLDKFYKVKIICDKGHEFMQRPYLHVQGNGCISCARLNQIKALATTKEDYVVKARAVHGDKYNYDKTVLGSSKDKINITCDKHGEFWCRKDHHLSGVGCKQCSVEDQKTKYSRTNDQFIEDAKAIHGDEYDYSKVDYINNKTKVKIICPIHGEFEQTPDSHINRKAKCPHCSNKFRGFGGAKERTNVREVLTKVFNKSNIQYKVDYTFPEYEKVNYDFYLPNMKLLVESVPGITDHHKTGIASTNKIPIVYFGSNELSKHGKDLEKYVMSKLTKNVRKIIAS